MADDKAIIFCGVKQMEILALEMQYNGEKVKFDLELIPFEDKYYTIYQAIYNECFYEMREALDVKPFNFYNSIDQIADKKSNIYLLIQNNELIGSVACYNNEIDDLIVNKKYQNQGYGQQLLLFAIKQMQIHGINPIKLHVANWNEKAVNLYERNFFKCINIEKINGRL